MKYIDLLAMLESTIRTAATKVVPTLSAAPRLCAISTTRSLASRTLLSSASGTLSSGVFRWYASRNVRTAVRLARSPCSMPPMPSHTTATKPPWARNAASSGSPKPNESCCELRAPMCCAFPGRKLMRYFSLVGARIGDLNFAGDHELPRPAIFFSAERNQDEFRLPNLKHVVLLHDGRRMDDVAI